MFSRLKTFLDRPGNGFRAPQRIFWIGLALRVLYMTLAHTWRIRTFQDHFQFGWETGRIARAVATGYGYADPFFGHSGPTTWISPLFTLLLAGVFKIFGVYSTPSAWIILVLNSIFSSATAIAVYEIAARCYDSLSPEASRLKRAALWSAWLWAVYPAAMQYSVRWIWDTSLSAFLLAWAVVFALRLRGIGEPAVSEEPGTLPRWAAFGLTWGLIALCNPSLILCLPAAVVWILWPARSNSTALARQTLRATLAAVLFCACLAPWVYRNWETFHAFIPARGNLGAELYQSTLEVNEGFPWGATLPLVETHPEFIHYKTVGEARYVKEKGEAAKINIRNHPRLIVKWTIQRVFFYWAGVPHGFDDSFFIEFFRDINYGFLSVAGILGLLLSQQRRTPGAWLLASVFLLQPVIYYAVTVQARFRHPIEPFIAVLGVYLFQSAEPRSKKESPAPRELSATSIN
jgi:hypothetical protein